MSDEHVGVKHCGPCPNNGGWANGWNEVRRLRKRLEEKHKRAQKCLDDADNMLVETQTERDRLKGQLEEARGQEVRARKDFGTAAGELLAVRSERDRLKAALVVLGSEDNPPTSAACRSFARQALTPQEDVCEECGGSGKKWDEEHISKGWIPCPKGCQPQTPEDKIDGLLPQRKESHRKRALEKIAEKSICACWEVPGMGSGKPYVWIGCDPHNSDDPEEWCICCIAHEALKETNHET